VAADWEANLRRRKTAAAAVEVNAALEKKQRHSKVSVIQQMTRSAKPEMRQV